MNGPTVTQFTIEEETSISELSDEGEMLAIEKKPIVSNEESKLSSSDGSSVSTDEIPKKSKTIFEELQLKSPKKGSVKDFVHAFNMLANNSETGVKEKILLNKNAFQNDKKDNKIEITNSDSNKNAGPANSFSIQSFPTKWEYQTNNVANFGYPINQYLLPIAEESHNETSEHDKAASMEDLNILRSSSNKSKGNQSKFRSKDPTLQEKTSVTPRDIATKKCTHCSEPHNGHKEENHYKISKKKLVAQHSKAGSSGERTKTTTAGENIKSAHASVAALASLLQDRRQSDPFSETPKKTSTSKSITKPDQPIMVSLYIEDKSSHRGPIPLLITPSMSLRKLKKQVEKEYKFPREQQCWILGESFAVRDESSLASYGVTDTSCSVLLYVMAKDSKSKTLPSRPVSRSSLPVADEESSTSSESELATPRRYKKGSAKSSSSAKGDAEDRGRHTPTHVEQKRIARTNHRTKSPPKKLHRKKDIEKVGQKAKSNFHTEWEADYEKKQDYRILMALDDVDLVANTEPFECPVCFVDIGVKEGAILQECLHNFCRECLASAVRFSETAVIKCPFRNDEYSCESHLQEREIKSLVTSDVYERHLQRSMKLAESQAQDSFHCKTPDCHGWCLYEDNVNTFRCPVCKRTNCLTCAAVHEGKNCRQYQDDVAFRCDSSEEAKKTKEYLDNMLKDGEAMECPKCQVILMKKWGCDWLKCSMCHTEVCWVTKGPRWGPAGRGDTSGGCKCMIDGVRCHPKCSYCH